MLDERQKVLVIENKRLHSRELTQSVQYFDTIIFPTLTGIMEYLVGQTNLPFEQRDDVSAVIVDGDLSDDLEQSTSSIDGDSVVNFIRRAGLFPQALLIGNYEQGDLQGVDSNLKKDRSQYGSVYDLIKAKRN